LSAEPPIAFAHGLATCTVAVERNPLRRSPRDLRRRLDALSDRHGGARAITQRTREVPQAYRSHYGVERSPAEELTLQRLIRGHYRSRGLVRDAVLIATIDTEVAVQALDAARLDGPLRVAGREIADDAGPLLALFADPAAATGPPWARRRVAARDVAVTRATRRLLLYAVTAPGIADLAVEEALTSAYEIIAGE
jgi:hypothetical protein